MTTLVLGAASGVGVGIVRAGAALGWPIIAVDRLWDAGYAHYLRHDAWSPVRVECDPANAESVRRFLEDLAAYTATQPLDRCFVAFDAPRTGLFDTMEAQVAMRVATENFFGLLPIIHWAYRHLRDRARCGESASFHMLATEGPYMPGPWNELYYAAHAARTAFARHLQWNNDSRLVIGLFRIGTLRLPVHMIGENADPSAFLDPGKVGERIVELALEAERDGPKAIDVPLVPPNQNLT